MPYSTKTLALRHLVKLREQQMLLTRQIDDAIGVARQRTLTEEPLCSWQEIGAAMNVTKQGAWQRWAEVDGIAR